MSKRIASPIRSVREQIADQLRNEILANLFAANEPMREAALAERFGTSRGPIRDVLLQLSQEGALVYKPKLHQRLQCRLLLCLLLGGSPTRLESPGADLHADLEALGVVRPLFVQHDVQGRLRETLLGLLLKEAQRL